MTSLARFNSGPNAKISPLSEKQQYALKVFEETCSRLALHMILDPGDIQLLSNTHVFHARTAYKDYPPGSVDEQGRPRVRRHLMRLWLSVPESEGGWKLPFHDSHEKKRGGIQVNDNAPVCPIDVSAEDTCIAISGLTNMHRPSSDLSPYAFSGPDSGDGEGYLTEWRD